MRDDRSSGASWRGYTRAGKKGNMKRTFKVSGSVRVQWEGPDGSNYTIMPADAGKVILPNPAGVRWNKPGAHLYVGYSLFRKPTGGPR